MSMKIIASSASLFVSFLLPLNAFASSCKDYPSNIGATVIPQENGPKIISTYQVSVPFDDADEVMDAYAEAKAEAKAQISEFMQTKIAKDCERKSAKLRIGWQTLLHALKVTFQKKSVRCAL